jgi:hypothetical protein
MFFEPTYFEARATAFLSRQGATVLRSYRVPIHAARYGQRPEVDALIVDPSGGEPQMCEFKSYRLDVADLDQIEAKYRQLTPFGVVVLAPSFTAAAAARTDRFVRTVEFVPDVDALRDYYDSSFVAAVPDVARDWMSSGLHHFRYLMPSRSPTSQKRFINQIDKRIRTPGQLRREILDRMPQPPTRVFWTTAEYRNPKWLFYGEGSPVSTALWACDIDGPDLHHGISPCTYRDGVGCSLCTRFSTLAAMRLNTWLAARGEAVKLQLDSGRRGIHLYVSARARQMLIERQAQRELVADGLRLDLGTMNHERAVVGFPGSLHGYGMTPVAPVASEPRALAGILPYRRR